MSKKINLKGCVSLLVASGMLLGSTAYAKKSEESLTAFYNNINIAVDTVSVIPRDANGNRVDPFIIDGTTYLPVRALANALGQNVQWNSDTNTVVIGGELDESTLPPISQDAGKGSQSVNVTAAYNDIKIVVNGTEIVPKDANGSLVEPFIIDGTTYLPVRALANALGQDVQWDAYRNTVYIGKMPFRADATVLKQFSDKELLTVGKSSVKGAFYNLLVAQNCNSPTFPTLCDNYSDDKNLQALTIYSTPANEFLANFISESLVPVFAVYEHAKENGFLEDAAVVQALASAYESYRKEFSTDAEFNAFLAECGISEADFKDFVYITTAYSFYADTLYSEKLNAPYSDEDLLKLCSESFVTAKHILVEDEKVALDIIKKLNKGTSFDKLMQEHNIDPGATPEGYTFTTGEMVPEFEEASFSLKENTYTKTPVQSAYGYHIIMRLPLDKNWIIGNKTALIRSIAANDANAEIEKMIAKYSPSFTDAYSEYVSSIK